MTYVLVDGEESARSSPATFLIPPRSIREGLRAGLAAKLMFNNAAGTERMWVQVTDRLADGRYVGRLDNYPVVVDAEFGDRITFGPEHVIDVIDDKGEPVR
jgi:hypothetical protein